MSPTSVSWPRRTRIQRPSVIATTPGRQQRDDDDRAPARVSTPGDVRVPDRASGDEAAQPWPHRRGSADDEVDQPAGHDDRPCAPSRRRAARRPRASARAAASVAASSASAGDRRRVPRTLPLTCTGDLDRVDDEPRADRRSGSPRRRASRRGRAAPTAPRRCAARAARPSAPAARRPRAGAAPSPATTWVSRLFSSNSRAIAVLKPSVAMSSRTAAIVRCSSRRVSSSAGASADARRRRCPRRSRCATAAAGSGARRRCRRCSTGGYASSGPMNIS